MRKTLKSFSISKTHVKLRTVYAFTRHAQQILKLDEPKIKKGIPQILMGASSSRRLGWLIKISRDATQSCLISDSVSCTSFPGFEDRTSISFSIILSNTTGSISSLPPTTTTTPSPFLSFGFVSHAHTHECVYFDFVWEERRRSFCLGSWVCAVLEVSTFSLGLCFVEVFDGISGPVYLVKLGTLHCTYI